MTAFYFPVAFDYEGQHYDGRVTPEIKGRNSNPSSFHVVLNEVFFGYVHKNNNQWHVSEQRPAELVQLVGEQIEKASHEFQVTE